MLVRDDEGFYYVGGNIFALLELADMYANKCTKQEEKFDYFRRNGCVWRWVDCEAAYDLLREVYGQECAFMMSAWRKNRVVVYD
jgi:hypothetical protein